MLVSYNWLNKYFDGKLPAPEAVAEAFTFHAWEIDDIREAGSDTVLDVKVLPDKAMWGLSHRGIAKDLSVILGLPLAKDPLQSEPELNASAGTTIALETDKCRRFAAARIEGVKVGPSPDWLKEALEAIGQRSINNIVDASNYVMFDLGQPSHAFDAALVGDGGFRVRPAREGETLVGLDENEYTFTSDDVVIARGDTDEILSIAGLKGGKHSGINEATTDVIVEVANWDPVSVRKTGQRLKLRTDASARYENGIVPEMIPYGLKAVTDLIVEVAGGEVVANSDTGLTILQDSEKVSVELKKINSVLGVSLTESGVTAIIDQFGWTYKAEGEVFTITPPFWRTDLKIAEDIIEEIGRIYGYEHVAAMTPASIALLEINQRFYYSELARDTLIELGFSEIYTSSFRSSDKVKLANAFASDKGYLRSSLRENMKEALQKNAPNADLLGVRRICLFEMGTIWSEDREAFMLALGIQSPAGYKAKTDDAMLTEALAALQNALGAKFEARIENGIAEIDFGKLLKDLPAVSAYRPAPAAPAVTYRPFSIYPAVARDIALWVDEQTSAAAVERVLRGAAGALCVRTTLFDEFKKDGRTSYAFRLVFQSNEKTLTDSEVNTVMDGVYLAASEREWQVR